MGLLRACGANRRSAEVGHAEDRYFITHLPGCLLLSHQGGREYELAAHYCLAASASRDSQPDMPGFHVERGVLTSPIVPRPYRPRRRLPRLIAVIVCDSVRPEAGKKAHPSDVSDACDASSSFFTGC